VKGSIEVTKAVAKEGCEEEGSKSDVKSTTKMPKIAKAAKGAMRTRRTRKKKVSPGVIFL